MKKILFLTLLLLMFVPCNKALAANKIEKPTYTISYNEKDQRMYITYHHSNKKAIILTTNGEERGYHKRKVNKPYKLITRIMTTRKMFARVGEKDSAVVKYNPGKKAYNIVAADMCKELPQLKDNSLSDVTKFLYICEYFHNNFEYQADYGSTLHGKRVDNQYTYAGFYRRGGTCGYLAGVFNMLCDIAGIKCDTVNSWTATYKYRDKHAWCQVYFGDSFLLVDPTCVASGYMHSAPTCPVEEPTTFCYYDAECDENFDLFSDFFSGNTVKRVISNNKVVTYSEYGDYTEYTYIPEKDIWKAILHCEDGEVYELDTDIVEEEE